MDLRADENPFQPSTLRGATSRNRHSLVTEQLAKLFCHANISLSDSWRYTSPDALYDHSGIIPFSQINGFLNQARQLLDAGADPNVCVNIFEVDGKILHKLIQSGVYPDVEFSRGYFEGYTTCFLSSAQMLACCRLVRTPLVDAAYARDITTVQLLVEFGACVQVEYDRIRNPFMPAIAANDKPLLSALQQVSSTIEKRISLWLTECMPKALQDAAQPHSDFGVVMLMMARGADDPFKCLQGHVPRRIIDLAVEHGIALPAIRKEQPEILTSVFLDHMGLCILVLHAGVSVEARDPEGLSALHVAVGNRNIDVCRFLLDSGANIHARDSHGMTPLLEGVYYGHEEAVRLLLAKGGRPTDIADQYEIPCPKGNPEWECNRLKGIWRRSRDSAARQFQTLRWSALHIAAYRDLVTILYILLENGADIAHQDEDGRTALDIAAKNSNTAAAFWLLE